MVRISGTFFSFIEQINSLPSSHHFFPAHFTMHMVEFIQLYTNEPHVWLEFRHHPSSSVFQPYIWLGYSLNDEIRRNEPHFLGHFKELHQNSVNSEMDHVHG